MTSFPEGRRDEGTIGRIPIITRAVVLHAREIVNSNTYTEARPRSTEEAYEACPLADGVCAEKTRTTSCL